MSTIYWKSPRGVTAEENTDRTLRAADPFVRGAQRAEEVPRRRLDPAKTMRDLGHMPDVELSARVRRALRDIDGTQARELGERSGRR